MEYTRELSYGMSGADVLYIKQLLFAAGYYGSTIKSITKNSFGADTRTAVQAYQSANGLSITGTIDENTWTSIVLCDTNNPEDAYYGDSDGDGKITAADAAHILRSIVGVEGTLSLEQGDANRDGKVDSADAAYILRCNVKLDLPHIITQEQATDGYAEFAGRYPHISADNLKTIYAALSVCSELRRSIVEDLLQFAYDYDKDKGVSAYPFSLYMWGKNLYDTRLQLYCPTAKDIEAGAKKYPQYYNFGRKEMILAAAAYYGYEASASDCSGSVVGELRKHKLYASSFDDTANSLCGNGYSTEVEKAELLPADVVGRDGHIGTYVGGGLVIEWVGGEYGCQLTHLDKRKAWSFTDKTYDTRSPWTKFRRLKKVPV